MLIGIASNAPAEWVREFQFACESLKIPHRLLDLGCHDWMQAVRGVDIVLWRIHLGDPGGMRQANLKIPVLEAMGIKCFPNSRMAALYDDKIRQTYFFQTNKYPIPETFVSFNRADALDYARTAKYPLVTKTSGGASSTGVSLVRDSREAERIIRGVFHNESRLVRSLRYRLKKAIQSGKNRLHSPPPFLNEWACSGRDRRERYVYFQEYIRTNGDVRVVTLGPGLIAEFSRRNRPNDFRASGSGLLEQFPNGSVPREPCDLALEISDEQQFSSMAYDFLLSERGWLIGEVSYTFLLHRPPWGYAEALYERRNGGYTKIDPISIGVLHVKAMLNGAASA